MRDRKLYNMSKYDLLRVMIKLGERLRDGMTSVDIANELNDGVKNEGEKYAPKTIAKLLNDYSDETYQKRYKKPGLVIKVGKLKINGKIGPPFLKWAVTPHGYENFNRYHDRIMRGMEPRL